jgi:hypothetical protein
MTAFKRISLALLLACLATPYAFAEESEAEPQGKGPVHEGFAAPHEGQPKPTPVVAKQPPKPVEELPPDQRPEGENVQWIPGYWAWDEDRTDFLWVSGFWRNFPPGKTWMPGSWRQVEGGWQWGGGFWQDAKDGKANIEYLPQPPAPLDDAGANTPAPSENHIFVPGNWVYRERYVWRPGFWTVCNPNWVWTPACYRWSPCGYVYCEGHWDYPFASRGCLFAPAFIPPAVYGAPGYVYTPSIIVREPCLYGAFFARRGFGAYYFGDYFAPRYSGLGFVAWNGRLGVSVSVGGFYDPLFSFYSCAHRADPFWGGGIHDLYAGRYRGTYMRPPVNIVNQTTVINNINRTVVNGNVANVNNVQMLTSLRDAPRTTPVRLQNVPDTTRRQQQVNARLTNDLATSRANEEVRLASSKAPIGNVPTTPRTVQINVPKSTTPIVSSSTPIRTPPPLTQTPAPGTGVAGTGSPKLDPIGKGPLVLPKVGATGNPPTTIGKGVDPAVLPGSGTGPAKINPLNPAPGPLPNQKVNPPKMETLPVPPKLVPNPMPNPKNPPPVTNTTVPPPAPKNPPPVLNPTVTTPPPVTPPPVVVPRTVPPPTTPPPVVVPRTVPPPTTPPPVVVPRTVPPPTTPPPVVVPRTAPPPVATPKPSPPPAAPRTTPPPKPPAKKN